MNKKIGKILSFLIALSLIFGFSTFNITEAASSKAKSTTIVKKTTAKKSTSKKTSKNKSKKKVTFHKERLIIDPPLFSLDTAPHSGMPAPIKHKTTKKKSIKKKK